MSMTHEAEEATRLAEVARVASLPERLRDAADLFPKAGLMNRLLLEAAAEIAECHRVIEAEFG